jgi:hypothetical protein
VSSTVVVVVDPSGFVTVVTLVFLGVVVVVVGSADEDDSEEEEETGADVRTGVLVRVALETTSSRGVGCFAGAAWSCCPEANAATVANRVATTTPAAASTTCGGTRRVRSGSGVS